MNILFKIEHMLISSQESHMEKGGSHNRITDSLASKEEEDEIESMGANVVKALSASWGAARILALDGSALSLVFQAKNGATGRRKAAY
jgi:hypothetical protein